MFQLYLIDRVCLPSTNFLHKICRSPLLHKKFLRKIGDHHNNPIAKGQECDAAFMVAWNEFLLIVEHTENSKYQTESLAAARKMQTKSTVPESTTNDTNQFNFDGSLASNSIKYVILCNCEMQKTIFIYF